MARSVALRSGSAAAAFVASLALLSVSCGPSQEDRASGARTARGALISDEVHDGGVPGFFWLPPIAPTTAYGVFEPGLAPEVIIERLPVGSAPPVASFAAAEVKTDLESHYMVNWRTDESYLDPALTYRIRAVLGWFELGYADVDVVSSGSELRNVATGEYIPLLDGRTLPIKFRIDAAAMVCPDRGPCQPKDQCHDAGTCDPLTGTCSDPEKPAGTACDDGNLCTGADACLAGACTGEPVTCVASDQCHDAGACDPTTGACSDPPKPDGSACDDGSLCTRPDACAGGACAGSPVVCQASDQCHDAGNCDASTGLCSNPSKVDGSACNDGDFCTGADACLVGTCVGSAIVCDDGDTCTRNGCDPLAAGADGVTGCAYVPDRTLPGCAIPPPQATVSIVGLAPATVGFFANQRLNFSVRLSASLDRPDYDVEFLLFPAAVDGQGIPIGTARIPLVAQGEQDYWVELDIPASLQPGSWEVAVHEYPAGAFFPPPDSPDPLVLVVDAAQGLPVLDVTGFQVSQAALLVDPDSTVDPAAPGVYRDAPFAADLKLVAQNYPAADVPVTAQLTWNGRPIPLRIWDPVRKQWVETLVLGALDADAPRGVYLELALAEPDAALIRADLGGGPAAAPILITVNGDGSSPEATCVVGVPDAPVNCRHTAAGTALLYAAPPMQVIMGAPRALALSPTGNTSPLRYEKSWLKSIGNEWARAGAAFSAFAQLSSRGYEASARGNVPVSLLNLPEFQFVDATASASALVDGRTSVGVLVKALGLNVYDRSYTGNPAEWVLGNEFPLVQREVEYSTTVWVYVVPVTFTFGASGELGLQGTISATFTPGVADQAALTLGGGPYARAGAFGSGAVGVACFSAGARVDLTLIRADLTAAATGTLALTKRTDNGRPLEIAGSLSEDLSYSTSFLDGDIALFVTYPTIRWCTLGRLRYACGFQNTTSELVLCSWPGYSYAEVFLSAKQDLFTIDVCTPTRSCDGLCGTIDNGCRSQQCSGCPAGQVCSSANACVPAPAQPLFGDDFEAYAAGAYPSVGWYLLWSGAGVAQVVQGIAHGGTRSFMLQGYTGWVRADGVNLDLTGRDRLTYRASVMVPSGSATGATVGLFERVAANESRDRNAVWFEPGQEIVATGATYGYTGITCQPDRWYDVQVEIDYGAALMDVWIDGAKVVTGLPAWPKVEPNVFFVGTRWSGTVSGTSTAYFDDVQVY